MWKPIQFAPPESFNYANASGGSVLDVLLATPAIDAINPDAPIEYGARGNSTYAGYTAPHIRQVVAHPWEQGVGQGNGIYRYLSPRNAVNTVANKLIDAPDNYRPPVGFHYDALALLVSGNSYSEFAQNLSLLLGLFSHPMLYMCARRSGQIAAIEQTKTLLPLAAMNAPWNATGEAGHATWCNFISTFGHVNSFSEADNFGAKSLEETVMLVSKKRADIATTAVTAADFLIGRINGTAPCKSFFIKDQPIELIRKQLLASDTGSEQALSVCVLFCADVDAINDLKVFFTA